MSNVVEDVVEEVLKIFNNNWNRQVVLYGPPGTSKTYSSAEIAAKFLTGNTGLTHEECEEELKKLADEGRYKVVQFHPSYSYEDFVRGIKVKADGANVTYEVESKIIEAFCNNKKDKTKVLVIDEINRAPLASVLGELIYGLEYRGKEIYTPYTIYEDDDKKIEKPLVIPDNLYIIGTMNTADRSIGSMDYAVRRRFAFLPVNSNKSAIMGSWEKEEVGKKALDLYNAMMNESDGIFDPYLADKEMDVEDIKIGHTYFLGKKKETGEEYEELDYLRFRIDYQIRPIYQEYIKDGIIEKEGLKRFDKIIEEIL